MQILQILAPLKYFLGFKNIQDSIRLGLGPPGIIKQNRLVLNGPESQLRPLGSDYDLMLLLEETVKFRHN